MTRCWILGLVRSYSGPKLMSHNKTAMPTTRPTARPKRPEPLKISRNTGSFSEHWGFGAGCTGADRGFAPPRCTVAAWPRWGCRTFVPVARLFRSFSGSSKPSIFLEVGLLEGSGACLLTRRWPPRVSVDTCVAPRSAANRSGATCASWTRWLPGCW